MDFSKVKGFNYQPGFAYNSYEAWRFFDADTMQREIGRGKRYFPKTNAIRLWLSYDAFRYEEDRQAENFETALKILDGLGLKALPVLFNCWHDGFMDNGGIYINQIVPGSCRCSNGFEVMYDSFVEKIVGAHAKDDRIIAWDICNEPFSYGYNERFAKIVKPYEFSWLEKIYKMCKAAGAAQPLAVSLCMDPFEDNELVAHISDIAMIHPYYYFCDEDIKNKSYAGYVELLKKYKAFAAAHGKQVLTTEVCWGSLDDLKRAEIVRLSLSAHAECGIGFIVHALNYSHVADLHDAQDGVVGSPGNLAFIDKEGKIRKGHEVFNEF